MKRHLALVSVQVLSLHSAAASSSAFLRSLASSVFASSSLSFASSSLSAPVEISFWSPNLLGHSAASAARVLRNRVIEALSDRLAAPVTRFSIKPCGLLGLRYHALEHQELRRLS